MAGKKADTDPIPAALTVKGNASDALLANLTDKQAVFARTYADTGNASEAARTAGYGEKHASSIGSRLLQQQAVKAAIERLRFEQTADLDITDATVLDGLLAEATWKGKGSSHAARVSAWKELADIKGLHKTPDIGAWGGISTLRIQVAVGDGTVREVQLQRVEEPAKP